MARITDNRYVFHWKGETVTITRRAVSGRTALRVRVTVERAGTVTRDDYRDYRGGDWSRGESVFAGHVARVERLIAADARRDWNAR